MYPEACDHLVTYGLKQHRKNKYLLFRSQSKIWIKNVHLLKGCLTKANTKMSGVLEKTFNMKCFIKTSDTSDKSQGKGGLDA